MTSTAAKSTDTCCHMPLMCASTGSTSLISAKKLINSNVQIMLNKPFAVESPVLKAQRKHTVSFPNRQSRVLIPPSNLPASSLTDPRLYSGPCILELREDGDERLHHSASDVVVCQPPGECGLDDFDYQVEQLELLSLKIGGSFGRITVVATKLLNAWEEMVLEIPHHLHTN